jgi:sec-independent protein translocase protein TatC
VSPVEQPDKNKDTLREMSFLEHLEDLRGVLVQSIVAFLLCSIVYWFFSGTILDLLIKNISVDKLNFFAPAEAFMARMKISFVLGLMTAFPFILFKVWSFVAPGLFVSERKKLYPFIVTSSVLFYLGVLFCYYILIPIVLDFLLGFETDKLNPMISVSMYFAFVARLCFTFGLVFQLPIVVLLLSIMGIVTPQFLLKQWRYAIVIIFVVSAILTPPDPASQVLMALPVVLLYIGSVLVAYIALRKKKEAALEKHDE